MALNKRKIFNWIKVLIFIYCAVGITLYYLQDKILFHPKKISADYIFKFDASFHELNIPVNKEDTINLIQFSPADDTIPKGLVIYFHGSKGNVEHYAERVNIFLKNGYEVWMPDYPGFGKSTGSFSELKLYEQAYQIKRLADNKFKPEQIVIYGQALGCAVAANLASSTNARLLILESAYYNAPDLFNNYLPVYPWNAMIKYKFSTGEYLEDVKMPIEIISGYNEDYCLKYSSNKLKSKLKNTDKFNVVSDNKIEYTNQAGNYEHLIKSLLK